MFQNNPTIGHRNSHFDGPPWATACRRLAHLIRKNLHQTSFKQERGVPESTPHQPSVMEYKGKLSQQQRAVLRIFGRHHISLQQGDPKDTPSRLLSTAVRYIFIVLILARLRLFVSHTCETHEHMTR